MSPSQTSILRRERLPFFRRILFGLQLWAFKAVISLSISITRKLKPLSISERATYTKSFGPANLTSHVFIPRSYRAGDKPLPLYISIHGGGFALGHPSMDDEWAASFCNNYGIVIVSINYPKTPMTAFPDITYAARDTILAVLADEELPVDLKRVAIGGFSAGGNLALSVCQLPQLQGKFQALIPWYPVTDFSVGATEKMKARRFVKDGEEVPDMLEAAMPLFNYGYLCDGQDLRDPLLSPSFADRKLLPPFIFTIAAELDVLAEEARSMMGNFMKKADVLDEDEAEDGRLRFYSVKEAKHGFTVEQRDGKELNDKRKAICDRFYPVVGEWLVKGPFAK